MMAQKFPISIAYPNGHQLKVVENEENPNHTKSGGLRCTTCKRDVSYTIRGKNCSTRFSP